MDIDNLKHRLEHLRTWHVGEEPLPAIEPVYNEAIRLLREACEDGDRTAYASLAALFDTPEDVPAGRVLKNIRSSVRYLSERWESELDDLLFEVDDQPPAGRLFGKKKNRESFERQERLRSVMEDILRQKKNIEEILEQEGPEIERMDAGNHPRLENVKYLEDPATLEKLSLDLMKLYTHRRKALDEAVQRIEDDSLARLKESLEGHLGDRGRKLAANLSSLEVEDEIDILKKIYPGGPTDLARLMNSASEDREERELLLQRSFVFEDIVLIDDRSLQRILRRIDRNDLMTALKGVDEEVTDKVFRNLSLRYVEELKEDMEYLGPVRRTDVEKMQDRIINIIREMEAEGELYIPISGEDEVVI